MAHINVYLYNSHQASASCLFSSIDTSVNTRTDVDTDADIRYGQDFNQ